MMKNMRLWMRLSIAFAIVTWSGVAFVYGVVDYLDSRTPDWEYAVSTFLNQPDGTVEQLAESYEQTQSWDESIKLLQAMSDHYVDVLNAPIIFELLEPDQTSIFITADKPVEAEGSLTVPIGSESQPYGFLRLYVSNIIPINPVRFIIGVIILNSMISVAVGVLISRIVTQPLGHLQKAVRAFRDHDLSYRANPRGPVEIVELGKTFNEMAEALEESEMLRRNLVADVAHELRTPLSVLQSKLYGIIDDVYPLEKSSVAGLYDQTRLLSRLVDDLHELSIAEAHQLPLNIQPTNLKSLLEDTMIAFDLVVEDRQITFQTDIPDNLALLQIDAQRINQVFYNLVNNAIRHTPPGGTITIKAGCDSETLHISVHDTGSGIPAEHLAHVFDRFYRIDASRQRASGGTGLGLAIVRAIVKSHGGSVSVESEGIPGRGSIFTIRLPMVCP
jgi:signal transduction histidine kinase